MLPRCKADSLFPADPQSIVRSAGCTSVKDANKTEMREKEMR